MDLRPRRFINVSVLIVLTLCLLQKAEPCRFGVGCPLPCHCKDDAECDPWSGKCPDGCADDGGVQWSGPACQIGNLALGKATTQSRTALLVQDPVDDPSTDIPLVGTLAVDGDLNTDVNQPPHCARAYATGLNLVQKTSWTVNLGQESTVYSVTVYTGDDCCGGAKGYFAVEVGSSTTNFPNSCGSSKNGATNADGSITVTCGANGLQRSHVKVHRPDQSDLTLCEVIVLGSTYIDCSQCPQDKTCDSIVGCEECIGKKLPDCKKDCDFGKYGVNCQSTCGQCADGTDCNKITGRCDNCDPWTTGDACEISIDVVDMSSIQLVADDVTSDAIEVTWPQVQVAEDTKPFYTYRFRYKPNDSTAWIEREHLKIGSDPRVGDFVGGLQYNTKYDFQMWVTRELDGKQDNGPPTSVLTEKTLCIAPAKPAKPEVEASVTADGMMTLNVTWQNVSGLNSGCDFLDKVELMSLRGDAIEPIDVPLDEVYTTIRHRQSSIYYDIRVRVTNNEGLFSQSDRVIYQGPDVPNQSPSSGDDDNEIDLEIVGICVGAVGILVLVIAGLMIYWSARNWSAAKKPRPRKQKKDIEETPRPFVVTGPLTDYPSEPETQDTAFDTEVPAKTEDTFIPVPEFEAYVQENTVDGNGVRVQFMALPSGLGHEVTVANRQQSLPKNRFRNILPYDKNRVVLDSDDNPDLDYINASYMSGYKDKPKYYVAMQGPLPNTVDDTWRAIWQLCSNTVVMVTTLQEGETVKCEQYWPNRGVQQTYGEIQVRTLEEEVYAHHTLRTFIVIKEGFKRTVKHFHFTDWPDLGGMDQAYPLLRFREVVRSIDHLATGPMLVHCSAGAGRSGVFIALDYLLEQAKEEGGVDVFECVRAMRENRPHMGGNVRQYVFLHTVLNEAFLYGRTAIPCARFAPAFAELKHGDGEDGNTSKLEDQFATVEKLTFVNTEAESAGLTDENMNKNRHNTLIPNDANRPLLKTRPGVDSDYINAVFVTSYWNKKGFIVTQTPLPNTVNDFWRLVSDYNVCNIVMMHENLDNDAAPTYWPQSPGKPTEYGGLEVTLHGESQTPKQGYIEREFNLSQDENLEGSNQLVKQWELLGWYKDHEIPDPLSTTLLSLVKDVNRWQRQSLSSSPVLIHCMDGATRSGLVCALNYLIDMAKTENKVDVFNAVRDIRMSRSQLVSNLDQYQFLHEAVLEYLAVDELEAAAN